MRRVVITGMGAITPLGNTVDEYWNGLKSGKVAFSPIHQFDTTDYKAKLAASVNDFDPLNYMDFKTSKRMETFSQYGVAAAVDAYNDSGLDIEKEDPYRVGVCVGSGVGSLSAIEREHRKLLEKGPGRVHLLLVPHMIANMATGNISIRLGLKGKSINVTTACATGSHSIGEAYRSIQCKDADVMFAGGAESCITPICISGFSSLTALSFTDDPARCSIPFDKERNGFVIGEGAGVLVLEEYEHAKARGAKIYAEIVGYGATSDAYHITSPAEDGMGAYHSMKNALDEAGVSTDELEYINAHGTSTHHNDLFETRAVKELFGEHAADMYVNSTKSMIGHLLGAAGAVEAIACVKELQDGIIHETAGYRVPDPECDLNYVTDGAVKKEIKYALSNSLAFGGHNASLLFKKYE